MSTASESESNILDTLPPERLLEADDLARLEAALEMVDDQTVVAKYLAYERSHRDREPFKRVLRAELPKADEERKASAEQETTEKANDGPSPKEILEFGSVDEIRDQLKEIDDRELLNACEDWERDHQERGPVLQAINLKQEMI